MGKASSLVFKITNRVQYKTVLKGTSMSFNLSFTSLFFILNYRKEPTQISLMAAAHSAVVLKAESIADKTEWLNKLRNVISSKGGQVKAESGPPMRQSFSDGSLVNNSVFHAFQILDICVPVCSGRCEFNLLENYLIYKVLRGYDCIHFHVLNSSFPMCLLYHLIFFNAPLLLASLTIFCML